MNRKVIKVYVTPQEHEEIVSEAERRKMNITSYAKMKLLDETSGTDSLRREIVSKMPFFYNYVNKIRETETKNQLTKWGEDLWQLLK